jgi:hypothetical protein
MKGTDFGNKHSTMGEEWNIWSWIQLDGFVLLVVGTFLYKKFLQPAFLISKYEEVFNLKE